MHIAFLNIQGNFDPQDRYWTAHPDFGGQLVYVKEVALALGRMGHEIDIVTRRIRDAEWPGFEADIDGYPGEPNVRIVRVPCGGEGFLRKQDLWPYIATEWVPNLIDFYRRERRRPDAGTSHYGDSGLAAAVWQQRGGPHYTFTAHSLGAQKLERLLIYNNADIEDLDRKLFFSRRIAAERVAMNHAARVITSTRQEQHEQYGHLAYEGAVDIVQTSRFSVIPPGVNLHIFDAGVHGPDDERIGPHLEQILKRDIAEERRGLPLVICSSRLEAKKNHVGLVLAFARSAELQAAANLFLVVHGVEDIRRGMSLSVEEQPIMDKVVATCEASRLWGKVAGCSLANQTELAAAYRHLSKRHSAFALPALYEPFGLAPLEAIAAGLPACVTRAGGPSESLYDEKTGTEYGVLVDASDPCAIAEGLLRLVGPSNEWQHFRDAGRDRVLDRYTWEATARGYSDVLASVAEQGMETAGLLKIPEFFTAPGTATDISIDILRGIGAAC
ncbi:MAG: glycosyltransferase [Gammaproteobacteria bacterium]|jgi:sucrose-phosphate synthase